MVRKKKTAADYERDLEQKKASYLSEGFDLSALEEAYKNHDNAARFLKRNSADHPGYDGERRELELSKELKAKHGSLLVIERDIRKRRAEELQAAVTNTNLTQLARMSQLQECS